jgi:hypothetical protein
MNLVKAPEIAVAESHIGVHLPAGAKRWVGSAIGVIARKHQLGARVPRSYELTVGLEYQSRNPSALGFWKPWRDIAN